MDQENVFAIALGLMGTPWRVGDVRFDKELKRLNIDLDFPPGSRFAHPQTGELLSVYDKIGRAHV